MIIIIIIIISYCIHMIISIPWPELDIRIPHFFITLDRVYVCVWMCVCVSIPWHELDIRIPHFFSLPLIVCVCVYVCVCGCVFVYL